MTISSGETVCPDGFEGAAGMLPRQKATAKMIFAGPVFIRNAPLSAIVNDILTTKKAQGRTIASAVTVKSDRLSQVDRWR